MPAQDYRSTGPVKCRAAAASTGVQHLRFTSMVGYDIASVTGWLWYGERSGARTMFFSRVGADEEAGVTDAMEGYLGALPEIAAACEDDDAAMRCRISLAVRPCLRRSMGLSKNICMPAARTKDSAPTNLDPRPPCAN